VHDHGDIHLRARERGRGEGHDADQEHKREKHGDDPFMSDPPSGCWLTWRRCTGRAGGVCAVRRDAGDEEACPPGSRGESPRRSVAVWMTIRSGSDSGTKPPPLCPVHRAFRVAESTARSERRLALPADLIRRGLSCQVESGMPEPDAEDQVIESQDTVAACRAAHARRAALVRSRGEGAGRFRSTAPSTGDEETKRNARPGRSATGRWVPATCGTGVYSGRGMPAAEVTIWRTRGSVKNSGWRLRTPRRGGQRRLPVGWGWILQHTDDPRDNSVAVFSLRKVPSLATIRIWVIVVRPLQLDIHLPVPLHPKRASKAHPLAAGAAAP